MTIRHFWLATPMFFFLLLWVASSAAHMAMSEPPPINYKTNPNYNAAKGDFDYSAPLSPSGSNYPCKGHLKDLDGPEGKPVRTYAQGGTYNMVISGSAVHGGGSCQASLSWDKGKTFKVIKSYVGNCPHATPGGDQTFKFTIPKDAPSGNAVFAWTWFNEIGNREMYMNCASVTIGGAGAKNRAMVKRAFSGPEVFKANIGNGCGTSAGTDVVFPNPGPNIEYGGNAGARAPPTGTCGQTPNTGGNSGTGGGSGSGSGSGTGTGTGAGASGTSTSGSSGSGSSGGTGTTGSDNSGAGAGSMGGGTGGSGNTGEDSETFISSSRGAAMGTATSRASSSAAKKTSKTVAKSQSYTSFNTPAYTGGGGAGGGDVVSTIIPGIPTGDGAVETNAAGGNSGNSGPSSVQDSQGCAYWRSQGYVCSGASKSLLGRKELLQMLGGILLVLVISGL